MKTHWKIQTKGDPVNAIRNFVRTLWLHSGLEGMLAPVNGSADGWVKPEVLRSPAQLAEVNPFKPLMLLNGARLVPEMTKTFSGNFGALLRPCEMRALIEMVKHDGFSLDRLLSISIDCLGTIPKSDYSWRAARKGSPEELANESLQFARQGGITAYRYRAACQLCTEPDARSADLNIGIIGLPVRSYILVIAKNEEIAHQYHLESITDGPADSMYIVQRERLLAQMAERRERTQERVVKGIAESLPTDVDTLVAQLESCGSCQSCLEVCPICSIDFPNRSAEGNYARTDVVRWLVSCAGCGMCEQSCPQHHPLSAIFNHVRHELSKELNYTPGQSIQESLPVI